MTNITYTFNDHTDLENYIESMELKPGASMQNVCTAIAARAQEEHFDQVRIEVSPELLADSYISVPAMFARSMRQHIQYPSLQSFNKDGMIVLIAAQSKHPTTFNRRALEAILKHRIFKVGKSEVPKSYRRRPGLLSRYLSDQTAYTVVNETRENEIVWKISEVEI